MKISIPKTFELGGRTWRVKHLKGKKRWWGRAKCGSCVIELAEHKTKQALRHTFLHELNHAILYTMARNKLFNDENFVDGHSSLLLQALTTAK